MTAARRRIALVSSDPQTRGALADYLTSAGFEVDEREELGGASSFAALVLVSEPEVAADVLVARVRSWIKLAKGQRIVVVTARPSALKELVAAHAERLFVLAAPAFGWDLVDALRKSL